VKVILDTNVFVSGVFFSGPPYRILEAWRDGKLQLVVSQEILGEYQRVGETLAVQFPRVNIQPVIDLVTTNAEIFPNQPMTEPVCAKTLKTINS
jgi:putative PIN family toxin of toxin-antitoxin system